MKIFIKTLILLSLSFSTFASEVKIENARLYAPMKGSTVTAGYFDITNETKTSAKIKLVSVEGFKTVELHETYKKEGRMGMRKVEEVTIKAGEKFSFAPGKHHIMLFDADSTIKKGAKVNATFMVNDEKVTASFKVISR